MARRETSHQLAADIAAAAINTSVTLWWRWPLLMSAGSPQADRVELKRMISEKQAAIRDGVMAAQAEGMRLALLRASGKQTPHAVASITAAALKPAFRTVKANARRLSKKR